MNTMLVKRFLILFVISIFAFQHLRAQQPNDKFGKPTDEEMNMKSYAKDESAEAVVLYSSTRVWYDIITGDFRLYTEVKKRIKILKKDGEKYANIEVPYYYNENHKSLREDIMGLKAFSYNMENGKLVKTKLENDAVVRERIDNSHMMLKFSFPQVKEGTVIEYQYKKESGSYFNIDTWVAQASIPVAYTEYNLLIPEYFVFNIDETGSVRTENKVENENVRFIGPSGDALSCTAERYIFVGRDMPAIKADSYVFCPLDYCKKVTAELRGLEIPGALYKNFTSTWEEIGVGLVKDEDFGGRIKKTCPIKDLVASSGQDKESGVVGKMAAIYAALKKQLKWNGEYKLYGQPASKVIKNGTGSNADINFILISAYKEAGLDARPVVMSRRTMGRLPLTHPSIDRLNTFVVGVLDGQNVHFIDASVEDGFVDVLPPLLLTEQGLLLADDGTGIWVNLQMLEAAKANYIIDGQLNADGTLNGTYKAQLTNNLSSGLKNEFRMADDSATFVNKMAERNSVTINSYKLEGKDVFSASVVENFEYSKKYDADGEHIYFSPFVIPPMTESPFKDVVREMPVEYPYKYSINMVTKVKLPEGYQVEEMPKQVIMATEDNALNVRANFMVQANDFIVQFRMNVNKTLFLPSEYEALRHIYDTVVEKCGEIVVLNKKQ